jgi:hypothetical protein
MMHTHDFGCNKKDVALWFRRRAARLPSDLRVYVEIPSRSDRRITE